MPAAIEASVTRGKQPRPDSLLAAGNSKLGKAIFSFSIPAITTCPGKSGRCSRFCYAARGHFVFPANQSRQQSNLAMTQSPDFIRRMKRDLRKTGASVVRIHVAGDFYDADYIEKWRIIAKLSPRVTFFAYTRSWRVDALVAPLTSLAAVPNMRLWLSEDRETGPAIAMVNARRASLVIDDLDALLVSPSADLVFRDQKRATTETRVKQILGVRVCPHEQGADMRDRVTCASCRICFK